MRRLYEDVEDILLKERVDVIRDIQEKVKDILVDGVEYNIEEEIEDARIKLDVIDTVYSKVEQVLLDRLVEEEELALMQFEEDNECFSELDYLEQETDENEEDELDVFRNYTEENSAETLPF